MRRYECTDEGSTYESFGAPTMKESPNGSYVLYDDIKPMIDAVKYLLAKNTDGNPLFQMNNGLTMLREALKRLEER